MNLAVIDTNVLIDFLENGAYAAVLRQYDRLLVPAPVDAEFRAGLDPGTRSGRARAGNLIRFNCCESNGTQQKTQGKRFVLVLSCVLFRDFRVGAGGDF